MSKTGWDLNENYRVRFIGWDIDIVEHLKKIKNFAKENSGITSINTYRRWDDEKEAEVFDSTIVYYVGEGV